MDDATAEEQRMLYHAFMGCQQNKYNINENIDWNLLLLQYHYDNATISLKGIAEFCRKMGKTHSRWKKVGILGASKKKFNGKYDHSRGHDDHRRNNMGRRYNGNGHSTEKQSIVSKFIAKGSSQMMPGPGYVEYPKNPFCASCGLPHPKSIMIDGTSFKHVFDLEKKNHNHKVVGKICTQD